jgi:hypothetical protein
MTNDILIGDSIFPWRSFTYEISLDAPQSAIPALVVLPILATSALSHAAEAITFHAGAKAEPEKSARSGCTRRAPYVVRKHRRLHMATTITPSGRYADKAASVHLVA